jgi:uracil-DNA glycosylase
MSDSINVKIEKSWKALLKGEFEQEYFTDLVSFVKSEYATLKIYPEPKAIFRAFDLCPLDKLKVVILGQDPYHRTSGYTADGLAFSVHDQDHIPPSLLNIFKELKSDLDKDAPQNGNLEKWARQGVLLLNTILTVRASQAGSHQGKGWEQFTDEVIRKVSEVKENLVFILWGSYARQKVSLIDQSKHLIIQSAHPSPFSADYGFLGSKPFSKTNAFLEEHQLKAIDW